MTGKVVRHSVKVFTPMQELCMLWWRKYCGITSWIHGEWYRFLNQHIFFCLVPALLHCTSAALTGLSTSVGLVGFQPDHISGVYSAYINTLNCCKRPSRK